MRELTPRKGVLFSRANLDANIMPSVPRVPKPPGTMIPEAVRNSSQALLYFSTAVVLVESSRCSASTQTRFSFRRRCMDECSRDLTTDM